MELLLTVATVRLTSKQVTETGDELTCDMFFVESNRPDNTMRVTYHNHRANEKDLKLHNTLKDYFQPDTDYEFIIQKPKVQKETTNEQPSN